MKKLELPKGINIIETVSIEFVGKDIIRVKHWDDFMYLLGGVVTIFKLHNSYYIISNEVAYVYQDGQGS